MRPSRFLALAATVLAAVAMPAVAQTKAPVKKAGPSTPAGQAATPRPRVIVVGWDGADWTLLDPLVAQGALPNLAGLLAKGRSWKNDSYEPMASPLIWTTLATGRTPVDHGVTDFQELDPKTRERLPISGRSRRVPAIWNLASAKGLTVGVVGWWATWPAEKVNGFLVSDRAAPVLFDPNVLSLSPALTWPDTLGDGVRIVVKREATPSYEDVAKGLKVTRQEFDAAVAAAKDLNDPITGYRKLLGVTRANARIALELYDRQKPEVLMVYLQATDEIGHVLGRFHPPKLSTVSDEEFRKYSGGPVAFYKEADRLLGEFVTRAERDGATLFLVSDHGFRWGDTRPGYYSGIQFDTAFLWHETPGILVAAGPAVTPSSQRGTTNVFDFTPTLCRVLGLPADPVFEGKPLAGVGSKASTVKAESWAKVPVERLVASGPVDKKQAEEFTRQLVALGYLTGSEATAVDARPADRAGTETSGSFQNVGSFLRGRGKVKEALEWYRKALEVNPKAPSAWLNLSRSLGMLDRWDESDDTLLTALKYGYNDPEAQLYKRVASYTREAQKKPAARAQLVKLLVKTVAAFPENDRYRASLGKALFEVQKCAESEAVFRELEKRRPADVEVLNLLALTNWCQGRLEEAKGFFRRSLAVNPNQPAVQGGLSELQRGGRFQQ